MFFKAPKSFKLPQRPLLFSTFSQMICEGTYRNLPHLFTFQKNCEIMWLIGLPENVDFSLMEDDLLLHHRNGRWQTPLIGQKKMKRNIVSFLELNNGMYICPFNERCSLRMEKI